MIRDPQVYIGFRQVHLVASQLAKFNPFSEPSAVTEMLRSARVAMEWNYRSPVLWAAAAMVGCIVLFSVLFPTAALGAFRVWVVWPAFNHCFLIIPLSLFMIWQRRTLVAATKISPDIRGVVALFILGLIWVAVDLTGLLEPEQFVIVTMLQATLFSILGAPMYRKLAAPFLYLYFLIPSGSFLIPSLQDFTARFTVLGLHLLGIPVFSTGAVIEIPAGSFAIAEACAGLRFLVAAVAFGVFFAILTYRSIWRRLAFVALSIVVPIIANGFRALALIAVAQWIGSPTAAMADHILFGWIFFSIVLVILIFIGQTFSDHDALDGSGVSSPEVQLVTPSAIRRMAIIAPLCVMIAGFGPLGSTLMDRPSAMVPPSRGPVVASPWEQLKSVPKWRPKVVSPARSFLESFGRGSARVDRFVALYAGRSRRSNLVRSANRDADDAMWTFDSSHIEALNVNHASFPVRVSTWLQGQKRRVVWSFFVVDGEVVASAWRAELDQLVAQFNRQDCMSAFVALSAEGLAITPNAHLAADFLSAMEPMPSYVCNRPSGKAIRQGGRAPNNKRQKATR